MLSGCSKNRPERERVTMADPLAEALRDFAPPAVRRRAARDSQDGTWAPGQRERTGETLAPIGEASTSWTIGLGTFVGEDAEVQADDLLRICRSIPQLRAATAERRGRSVVVALGAFEGPDEPRAQRALSEVRSLRVQGQQLFAPAVLMPPATASGPDVSELDLAGVHERFGPSALYTLKIAAYQREDREAPSESEIREFRTLAERVVQDLRKEAVPAFFSHGLNSSSVTVGVFTNDDYAIDPSSGEGMSGPRVEQWRREFPDFLLNGKQVFRGGSERAQPSYLVAIPKR